MTEVTNIVGWLGFTPREADLLAREAARHVEEDGSDFWSSILDTLRREFPTFIPKELR